MPPNAKRLQALGSPSAEGLPNAAELPQWLRFAALAGVCLLPLAAFVLFSFPPGATSFYPQCVFHQLTGFHCPGCGATRALHALLHGDWLQAIAWNPWFVLSLPLLGWFGIRICAAMLAGRCWRSSPLAMIAIRYWIISGIVFFVLRNIGLWPMS